MLCENWHTLGLICHINRAFSNTTANLKHYMHTNSFQTISFPQQRYMLWLLLTLSFQSARPMGRWCSIETGYLQWNNSINCETLISKFVNIYIYINYNITELFPFAFTVTHDRSNTHHRFKYLYKMKYVHKKIHAPLSPIFLKQLLELGTK